MARQTSDLLSRRSYSSVEERGWNEGTTVNTPRGEALVRPIEVAIQRQWQNRRATSCLRAALCES